MEIVDYSFSRPDPADIAAAGFRGAMRYLAPEPNRKVIQADEIQQLHAASLSVGFVYESVAQRAANSGYNGGKADAERAVAMLQARGAPAGVAIYYVLEDPTRIARSLWPTVFEYCQGVLLVGGPYRIGGYGSEALLLEALDRNLIELAWQVGGWSTGPDARCALYQKIQSALGGTCDVDIVQLDDWGQWAPPGQPQPPFNQPAPAPGPTPPEDEPVFCSLVIREGDATVWRVGGGLEPVWVITFKEAEYIASVLGLHFNEPTDTGALTRITDSQGETRAVWKVSDAAATYEFRIPKAGAWPAPAPAAP